jgi:acyl-CoA synthetase (AMP-forming)/AMP-acid ligase II
VLTICWTSGTTGTPKGVPRSPSMWLASAQNQVDSLGLGSDDRILCPFPIVNMAGIGGMVVPWAITGAALLLHQPLDLPVFLGQLVSEKITYTVAPPAVLNMLLADESLLEGVDLSNIRKISSGAAPLDPWMVEGWDERGIEIVNIFGSNEGAGLISTAGSVPDPAQRARFFPRPSAEGVEVRLVDLETGDDITGPEEPGELRFRGPTVFDGYLGSTGVEFDDAGFYRTGDIFEWVDTSSDTELLRFVDRAKDIIIRGGMNISAAELEGLIVAHESVGDCAAIGYRDRALGERVGVFVAPSGGETPTLEAIVAHLQGVGVASYKLPERFELIDALPRNPLGKIAKNELRARWVDPAEGE